MYTLTYGLFVHDVDHAVMGPDYIHGYDANGNLIVAYEGITDFEGFEYTGDYLMPEMCMEESCNDVKHVNGQLVRKDGTPATHFHSADDLRQTLAEGPLVLSSFQYGDTLPETAEDGTIFFLKL